MQKIYQKIVDQGVGTVVRTKVQCMEAEPGTLAIVYEVYKIGNDPRAGVSLISINKRDWGGFSERDVVNTLEYVGHVPLEYEFINCTQTVADIRRGIFDQALAAAANLDNLEGK